MRRLTCFVIVLICISILTSTGFAWTDAVEGMLMPTPRGEDDTSDPEAAMENIEPTEDEPTAEESATDIDWE